MGDRFYGPKRRLNNNNNNNHQPARRKKQRAQHVNDSGIVLTDCFSRMTTLSAIESTSGCGIPLPNIQTINLNRPLRYSREVLIRLMNHPLSRRKPSCLDANGIARSLKSNRPITLGRPFVSSQLRENRGIDRTQRDTADDGEQMSTADETSKRKSDSADGVRNEEDIVLSPQRRSFNSGCFVNPSQHQLESPTSSNRDSNFMGRRIGSGRITSHDPDRNFDSDNFRTTKERIVKKNEIDKDKYRREKGTRFGTGSRRIEEEPEWFSAGPSSQHDTIELHGFDDAHEERKQSGNKRVNNSSNSRSNKRLSVESSEERSLKRSIQRQHESRPHSSNSCSSLEEPRSSSSPKKTEFTLDDFFKCDSIPHILTNREESSTPGEGSRFSRWFKTELEEMEPDRSSTMNNPSNDKTELTGDNKDTGTDAFTPASSASARTGQIRHPPPKLSCMNSGNGPEGRKTWSNGFLDAFHLNAFHPLHSNHPFLSMMNQSAHNQVGRVHSVEELEARLRRPNQEPTKEEETKAFERMLNQVVRCSNTNNVNMHRGQPNNLLQMLNRGRQPMRPASAPPADLFHSSGFSQNYGPTGTEPTIEQQRKTVEFFNTVRRLKLQKDYQLPQRQHLGNLWEAGSRPTSTFGMRHHASPYRREDSLMIAGLINRHQANSFTTGGATQPALAPHMAQSSNRGHNQFQHLEQQQQRRRSGIVHDEFLLQLAGVAQQEQVARLMQSTAILNNNNNNNKKAAAEQQQLQENFRRQQELQRQALHLI